MPEEATSNETTEANDAEEPKSEEEQRLEEEKRLAVLRKEIAVAEKEELAAKLPSSETLGKDGTVSLAESAGYYAEVLAYKTLTASAEAITQQAKPHIQGRTVILVDEHETGKAAALWELIYSQLERFDKSFDALLAKYRPPEVEKEFVAAVGLPLLAALPSLLGAAADVASFFRVNRKLTGRKVELSNEALLAETARVLQDKGHQVVLPDLKMGGPGKLMRLLAQVRTKFHDADVLRNEIKADEEKWKKAAADFKLLDAFDAFAAKLTAAPAGGAASPLESVATIDWMREDPDARLLYVKVVSQGGDVETTEGTFRKGKITFLAGTVVVFFLLDGNGVLLASGTVAKRETERFKSDD